MTTLEKITALRIAVDIMHKIAQTSNTCVVGTEIPYQGTADTPEGNLCRLGKWALYLASVLDCEMAGGDIQACCDAAYADYATAHAGCPA